MLFNSIPFVFFFPVVAILYYVLPDKARWVWLLIASIFFYMVGNPLNILVPVFIIVLTYLCGILVESETSPKKAQIYHIAGIVAIVGILIFFKYINFFTDSIFDAVNLVRTRFMHASGTVSNSLLIKIITPLSISYITFQAIGYLIEIKQGNHKAERNLGHFSTYLLFFPKLIAGPVERAHHFLPQLKTSKAFDLGNATNGLQLVLWGLFKKVVIADNVGIFVHDIFHNPDPQKGILLVAGCFLYTIQMYADFSGYTDMAIGLSRFLGFDLIRNFDRPFSARSMTEFWRKWHISLSTWFADYFYKPIAIKRRNWGNWSIVYASMVTFIVLGFWHGANWTYIVFGGLHGFMLALEFITKKLRKNIRNRIPAFINDGLGMLFTFLFFTFTLIFFRADTVSAAFTVLKYGTIGLHDGIYSLLHPAILHVEPQAIYYILICLFCGALLLIAHYLHRKISDPQIIYRYSGLLQVSFYIILLFVILVWGNFGSREFIYAKF
jgi:alginate O-acetyltransferase complex protein AlgI